MEERKALLSDVKENPPATEEKPVDKATPKNAPALATMDDEDNFNEMMTEQTYIPVEPKALFRGRPMYLIVRASCKTTKGPKREHLFSFSDFRLLLPRFPF